jgi:hypothetical protein
MPIKLMLEISEIVCFIEFVWDYRLGLSFEQNEIHFFSDYRWSNSDTSFSQYFIHFNLINFENFLLKFILLNVFSKWRTLFFVSKLVDKIISFCSSNNHLTNSILDNLKYLIINLKEIIIMIVIIKKYGFSYLQIVALKWKLKRTIIIFQLFTQHIYKFWNFLQEARF